MADAYRHSLGRDPGEADYAAHAGNPYGEDGVGGVLDSIVNSPEAKAYGAARNKEAADAAAAAAAGTTTPPPKGKPSPFKYSSNFNFEREDPSKSARNQMLVILEDLEKRGIQMPRSKEDAEAFAMEHLFPAFEAGGYDVRNASGDTFQISTHDNDNETIDWLIGAGGNDPQLGWLSDFNPWTGGGGGAGDAGAAGGAGGPLAGLGGLPGGSDLLAALMAGNGEEGEGSALMAQIQAELQNLLSGRPASTPNVPGPR